MLRKGKQRAPVLTKARILLKADVSEGGEGWSDSRIIEALGTNASTVHRTRKQLVEKGLDAVLSRKPRATPAVTTSQEAGKSSTCCYRWVLFRGMATPLARTLGVLRYIHW